MLEKNENVEIVNMIYEVRGQQVMFDSDLAKLYGTETKRINEAVRRNKEKFPERFSWVLSDEESNNFLVANCDQKIETRGGKYKNPRVFTEQGVAMLATILKTSVATQISIAIMDAFVLMKKYISTNLLEQKYINNMVLEHENEIKLLKNTFSNFKEKTNEVFFEGQIYDAYSLLLNVIESSKESIIIIDNYANQKLLDLLSKTDKKITIFSSNMSEELIKKYNIQYNNVTVINNTSFHDRFIIIDKNKLYHTGASFKDLGKKCFAINLIEDYKILNNILNELNLC